MIFTCQKAAVKKKKPPQPSRRHTTVLRQLVELIPSYLVPKRARETGVDDRARTFSPWSHVVTMLYAQISHAFGLNDVCDALRLQVTYARFRWLSRSRTTPPRSRISNGLPRCRMRCVKMEFCSANSAL